MIENSAVLLLRVLLPLCSRKLRSSNRTVAKKRF